MILQLNDNMTRLAIKIASMNILDYENIRLVIYAESIPTNGSPWFLTGCWPYHPTCVDVANHAQPAPAPVMLQAFERDDEGRIVFILPERLYKMPKGRYRALVQYSPPPAPINVPNISKPPRLLCRFDIDLGMPAAYAEQAVVEFARICDYEGDGL